MPIYEYVCEDCRKPFEKIVLNRAEPIACPSCGSERHQLQLSVVAQPRKAGNGESAAAAGPSCCASGGCGCN
ncbi:MAG: zinc ribbon domain-containing protein [Acidobacteria bacterium]|nr:zinc ribbon domain-containing protein [Acidobacteriota bacterium]